MPPDPGETPGSGPKPIVSLHAADSGMRPLIAEYVADLPRQAAEIRRAIGQRDLPAAAALAHRLRGVGGMYGYPDITMMGGLLEDAARESRPADLLADLAAELEQIVERIALAVRGQGHP